MLNPVFANEDIIRERGVILEEIKMDEDNPDYLVHEIFTQNFWKDHPLASRSWARSERSATSSRTRCSTITASAFVGGNMVFSAAGNLEHDDLCRWSRTVSLPAGGRTRDAACTEDESRASICATKSRWNRCSFVSACRRRRSP